MHLLSSTHVTALVWTRCTIAESPFYLNSSTDFKGSSINTGAEKLVSGILSVPSAVARHYIANTEPDQRWCHLHNQLVHNLW